MSGPRDTRESAEEAEAQGVPASPAPPSFGGAEPADEAPATAAAPAHDAADSAASAPLPLPPFGLQTPWWAAEPQAAAPEETTPAEATGPAAGEPAPGDGPAAAPASQAAPPGTLVAGVGVPDVDSRNAVPAAPLRPPPIDHTDTDPDGIPLVPPQAAPSAREQVPDAPAAEAPSEKPVAEPVSRARTGSEPGGKAGAKARRTKGVPTASPTMAPGTASADGERTAFEKAKEAESTGASRAPVLVPDAILPPGVLPPTGSGPYPHGGADGAPGAARAAVMSPPHEAGGFPFGDGPAPAGGGGPAAPSPRSFRVGGGAGDRSRLVLIGGGAALVLAAVAGLFALGSGSGGGSHKKADPPAGQATPTQAAPQPVDIGDERTDPKDLPFNEVFPDEDIEFDGHVYVRDRWSINRRLSYAANGAMLEALRRQDCRKIVRATYIDRKTSLAVTAGVAVMPNKAASAKIGESGDPVKYEWFRGMSGKHAVDVDRGGGYAGSTIRGRYVIYAYVQWGDGKDAKPGDPLFKQVAQQFLDYTVRPIEARARK